ncbi:DNA-binding protein [Neisseria yangbaofengii]|uniref:DNA-binding protein n=1 Tax=Neisseria yangbaofengii TaxID=2709396 RepID=UPI0013ED4ED5|nr:DNA-binding protein [Neisseria yangbaofengii]
MNHKTLSFKPLPYPQTPDSARAYFIRRGINRSAWARHFGLPVNTVTHLLRGRYHGMRGMSHEAAVLLGLKERIDEPAR